MTASTDYPDRWRRAASAPTQNATSEAVVSAVDSYVAALTPDQFDQLVAPHPRPLMINIAMIGARHAKALLTATTDCGGTLPKALSDLVDSLGAVAKAGTITDPTNDLIKAVLAGTLRGDELDERIAQAARPGNRRIPCRAAATRRTGRHEGIREGPAGRRRRPNHRQPATPIRCRRKSFDRMRHRRPEHRRRNFLAGTDEAGRQAWQAINTHVDVLNKIVSCVTQFGAKSTSFPLIELPANLHGTAGIHDLASLCTARSTISQPPRRCFTRPGHTARHPGFWPPPRCDSAASRRRGRRHAPGARRRGTRSS